MARPEPLVGWFDELAAIGRTPTGGWHRFAWTSEDAAARAWFERVAASLDLEVECDRNGNLWAWWVDAYSSSKRQRTRSNLYRSAAGPGSVVTGSHLDTVAEAGAYDGALGVVSGFAAIARLRQRRGADPPPRAVAVVAFADEEGGRFNLPCFGSRLLTGDLDPADILDRPDADGVALRDAVAAAGLDPDGLGADPDRIGLIGAFVELHVEQGRGLADSGHAIAVATAMWPHGRWRMVLSGEANHAGTTRLEDRHDPLLVAAHATGLARSQAESDELVATVGRMVVEPNSPNTIPAEVTASLDARAPDDARLDGFVHRWEESVRQEAARHGVEFELAQDARTAGVEFDEGLRARITGRLAAVDIAAVPLPTAAGHDAGVLARRVPAAMLFVRNPTGASHTPSEFASVDDCVSGVDALAAVVEDLAWS